MMRHRVPNGVITGELAQEAKNQARYRDWQRSEDRKALGRPERQAAFLAPTEGVSFTGFEPA